MQRKTTLALATLLLLLSSAKGALAGFGISPPYVENESLTRNSVFVQKITIVRGDPVEDLRADITINIPGTGYTQNLTSPAGNNVLTSLAIPSVSATVLPYLYDSTAEIEKC